MNKMLSERNRKMREQERAKTRERKKEDRNVVQRKRNEHIFTALAYVLLGYPSFASHVAVQVKIYVYTCLEHWCHVLGSVNKQSSMDRHESLALYLFSLDSLLHFRLHCFRGELELPLCRRGSFNHIESPLVIAPLCRKIFIRDVFQLFLICHREFRDFSSNFKASIFPTSRFAVGT